MTTNAQHFPAPGELVVACDGSCLSNPDGPTGWAWAAQDGRAAYGGLESGTNNIGELLAVLAVLRDFPDTPLLVQIDSQYAMKAATIWLPGWKAKGWLTAAGKPIKNPGIIKDIDILMMERAARDVPIRFQWVKGHRTDNAFPLNTEADRLAGLASARAATGLTERVDLVSAR